MNVVLLATLAVAAPPAPAPALAPLPPLAPAPVTRHYTCPTDVHAAGGVPQAVGDWAVPASSGTGYTGPLSWVRPMRDSGGLWTGVRCGYPGVPGPLAVITAAPIQIVCFYGEPDRCGGQSLSSWLGFVPPGATSCAWNDAQTRFDCTFAP